MSASIRMLRIMVIVFAHKNVFVKVTLLLSVVLSLIESKVIKPGIALSLIDKSTDLVTVLNLTLKWIFLDK